MTISESAKRKRLRIKQERINALELENRLLKQKFDKSILNEQLNKHQMNFEKRKEIRWLRLFLILSMIANAIFIISYIRGA